MRTYATDGSWRTASGKWLARHLLADTPVAGDCGGTGHWPVRCVGMAPVCTRRPRRVRPAAGCPSCARVRPRAAPADGRQPRRFPGPGHGRVFQPPRLAWRCVTWRRMASQHASHVTSHHGIAAHRIASHGIAWHRMASRRIASHRITPHRTSRHRIPTRATHARLRARGAHRPFVLSSAPSLWPRRESLRPRGAVASEPPAVQSRDAVGSWPTGRASPAHMPALPAIELPDPVPRQRAPASQLARRRRLLAMQSAPTRARSPGPLPLATPTTPNSCAYPRHTMRQPRAPPARGAGASTFLWVSILPGGMCWCGTTLHAHLTFAPPSTHERAAVAAVTSPCLSQHGSPQRQRGFWSGLAAACAY